MGVWIETNGYMFFCTIYISHTLRGCVDWNPLLPPFSKAVIWVTPCVGVWIETLCRITWTIWNSTRSHPAWVCGLKRKTSRSPILLYGSHPAWVCGLKQLWERNTLKNNCHTLRGCVDWNDEILEANRDVLVTPCVGVWIETCQTRL